MQCQGINKNGQRCHRITKDKKCWQHRIKSPKPSPKSKVVIYTTKTCSYCIKAKKLLNNHNITYKEIVVNPMIMKQLIKRTGSKTVPQIFINGKFIGGYTELTKIIK